MSMALVTELSALLEFDDPPREPSDAFAPVYLAPTPETAARSLLWVWNNKRCGVYLRVSMGDVVAWTPFANPGYRNKFRGARGPPLPPGAIADPSRWWFNGSTVCNVVPGPPIWGSAQLPELYQIISEGLEASGDKRASISFEAIVNKRDGAYLHKEDSLPDWKLDASPVLPVMSQYGGPRCWDVIMPCSSLIPARALADRDPAPWDSRKAMAVFRGSATGAGVTPETNQRLELGTMREMLLEEGLADVGLTSLTKRDRVIGVDAAGILSIGRVDRNKAPRPTPRIDMAEQEGGFRYAIYLEGHSAALRYLELMLRGFTVIKVDPSERCVASELWFFRQLVPGRDHVRVSAVSEIPSAIRALRADEDRGRAIAAEGRATARRIVAEAPSYMAKLMADMTEVQSGEHARRCVRGDKEWMLYS